MKYFFPLLLILFNFECAFADDNVEDTIDYEFRPGEVLSADVLNDIINRFNSTIKGINSPDEILGTWDCTRTSVQTHCADFDRYSADGNGLTYSAAQVVTFYKEGVQYAYTAEFDMRSCLHPVDEDLGWKEPQFSYYDIKDGRLILGSNSTGRNTHSGTDFFGGLYTAPIKKLSQNHFTADMDSAARPESFVSCRKNVSEREPALPSHLIGKQIEATVVLEWTDKSTNESGYEILRRDSIEGEYQIIAVLPENSTEFVDDDNTFTTQSYWYRVRSINENGPSMGSNVVMIRYVGI